MKQKTIYQCEYCLTEYDTYKDAFTCEASCLKLTESEYREYLDLLDKERVAGCVVSVRKNEETEKMFDDAIRNVIEFQKKHGITDSKW